MTKQQFIIRMVIAFIALFVFGFLWYVQFPYDSIRKDDYNPHTFGAVHMIFNVLYIIGVAFLVINSMYIAGDKQDWKWENSKKFDKYSVTKINFSFKKTWLLWLIPVFLIYLTVSFYSSAKFIYNRSVIYHNTYEQKVQEKFGFYDKMWKTYLQKEKVTNLNKETFIQVTSLIMENRKDGSNLAWKWVKENQHIPYSEFTIFYKDLSAFVESQREAYFNIEKECQLLANQNNTLLDTLPNNVYNRVIGCKRIDFEYGFLSDSTNNVFKSKIENVK